MHINDLPLDVLSLLMKYTVGMQAQNTKNWRPTIQLLGVCTKWRHLARPWVHYWAFIECYDSVDDEPYDKDILLSASPKLNRSLVSTFDNDDTGESGSNQETIAVDTPQRIDCQQDPLWTTNIDFLVRFGSPRMVKQLELYLDSPVHLLHFLRKAGSFLQMGKIEWPGIKFLIVNLFSIVTEVEDEIFEGDDVGQCAMARHIATKIFQSIGNVRTLRINNQLSHQDSMVSKAFATALVNLYISQLDALLCHIPMKFTEPSVSRSIRRISMAADANGGFGNTKIPTALLESVAMLDLPLAFPWRTWHDDSHGGGMVNFANLESISLSFASPRSHSLEVDDPLVAMYTSAMASTKGSPMSRVSAPKLKQIRMEYCPPGCPIFFASDLSKSLDVLHLAGPIYLLDQARCLEIDSVKELRIYLDSINETDAELFYTATNHLFGKLKIDESAAFTILNQLPFAIDSDRLYWHNLDTIDFPPGMELDAIVHILEALPYLQSFSVSDFRFDALMARVGYINSPHGW
ncbi:hypothetical protein GGI23_000295 [Coemansia sp. RSA 2559]|nr:hypothetical protein GGI23_000295 [Coemansia sp. RSA 2559]